ncbi:hypothetical protein QZH47_18775 [Pseudomonas corrugata]
MKTVAGGSLKGFLARYFPVFMGTILLACFSGSTLLVLVGMTYWRTLEPSVRTDYVGLGTLALVLVVGNFLMARGRVWAVCSGLLSGLSGYGNFNVCLPAASGVYLFAMLLPLLGLLLLNSKRHREMRSKLVDIRRQRQLIIHAAKVSRARR